MKAAEIARPEWLGRAYAIANRADCASPDTGESPGAALLLSVAEDAWQWCTDNPEHTEEDAGDAASEIADSAPSVYTHRRWQEFVDLAAWAEDITEYGPLEDMEKAAGVALYMIAERAALAVMEAYRELRDAAEDDATE